jgi:DNA-binding transcriptional regulator PaaX
MTELRPHYQIPVILNALDYAILQVLLRHHGRAHAVSRNSLLSQVGRFNVKERILRDRIKQLRRAGFLIGSAPGEDGGYYLITDAQEFEDFMREEFMAKIGDMSETVKAMRYAAAEQFGPAIEQPYLL